MKCHYTLFKPIQFKLHSPAVHLDADNINYEGKTKYLGLMGTRRNFRKGGEVQKRPFIKTKNPPPPIKKK